MIQKLLCRNRIWLTKFWVTIFNYYRFGFGWYGVKLCNLKYDDMELILFILYIKYYSNLLQKIMSKIIKLMLYDFKINIQTTVALQQQPLLSSDPRACVCVIKKVLANFYNIQRK